MRPILDSGHHGGHGEPLLLLHGAAMSWRAWRPVIPALEAHHAVHVPTLPGHRGGRVLADGSAGGVGSLVDVLCDDLDRAGVGTVHVVGNSLGGWVAFELARRGRARSVVAFSPAGAWSGYLDLQRLVLMFRLGLVLGSTELVRHAARQPLLRRLLLRTVLEHGDRIPDAELEGMFDDFADCHVLGELLAHAEAQTPLGRLDDLSCPVRVAWAEQDRIVPYRRYGRPLRAVLPGAEFVRLRGVGHVPMYDDPTLVARTILEVTAQQADRAA